MYQVSGIYVLYVCGNVNRRHHVAEAIRSHNCLKKTLYIDVARNSRTRIIYIGNCRELECAGSFGN